ncbi:hypothetical protein BCF55_1862 [Hydrogenivirga caldilitoris]|uniref:Uncharacterized protein n=1 Tax=Hydrogenivirga caldilitoris TaxID=246264 RepID=A0A497XRJ3_9AQUI|nr:hypothetical protein [Hydrogenivirga caldilitoris]RLJ71558.1 hypothetical protein BCF55_1862 [Hydrogenivirga caldilitoris]
MAVRVVISKSNPDIPDEFIFSVLSSTLGMTEEEYKSIRGEDGSVSLYVRDPGVIIKLQQIHEKHSSLLKVSFESAPSGGVFSLTNEAVKANWGLVLSWGAVVVLMAILSLLPILGVVINIFLSVFYYAFPIFVAHRLSGSELTPEGVRDVMAKLRLGEAFSSYLGAGFGFWLGFLVMYVLSVLIFVVLALLFGGLGVFSDLINHGSLKEGAVGAVLLVFFLMFLFWLWIFYSLPLIVARCFAKGSPSFESSFLAVLSVFTVPFIKESFSNRYVGIGGIWSLALTVGVMGLVVSLVLIITIPVSVLILYWLQIFLSVCAVFYIKKS